MSICLINKLSDKNNWFPIMLEIDSHILNVKLFINKFHDEVKNTQLNCNADVNNSAIFPGPLIGVLLPIN